jgi:hypothetical protein
MCGSSPIFPLSIYLTFCQNQSGATVLLTFPALVHVVVKNYSANRVAFSLMKAIIFKKMSDDKKRKRSYSKLEDDKKSLSVFQQFYIIIFFVFILG